jgi:hypothetical protein
MKVHPAADIFPMMADDELAALAEDIKANGLIHPIIIDADKQLIDGRNRFKACQMAGVEPRFEQLNGHDPLAFIVSANLERRNLTKGQQVMTRAMIYPEAPRGRGQKDPARKVPDSGSFSQQRLNEARTVLRHSRALADEVLKGNISLDAALAKVEAEKLQAQGEAARRQRLRAGAPDLADLVDEERMPLAEALAAWHERETTRVRDYRAGVRSAERILDFASEIGTILMGEQARGEDDPPIRVNAEHLKTILTAVRLLEEFCEKAEHQSKEIK